MALVTDPDELTQGKANGAGPTGFFLNDLVWAIPNANEPQRVQITSAGGKIPIQENQDYFEVRGHSTEPQNDGLYLANTTQGAASVTSLYADKINVDLDDLGTLPVAAGAAEANVYGTSEGGSTNKKNVMIDVKENKLYILEIGTLGTGTANGVTHQALYSFLKEEWKNDDTLITDPFPIVAITPEQFEWLYGWVPEDVTANTRMHPAYIEGTPSGDAARANLVRSRKMIRTGGWTEKSVNGNTTLQNTGVITLGTFDTSADPSFAYYQLGTDSTNTSDTPTIRFSFDGPANEAIVTQKQYQNSEIDTLTFVDGGAGNDSITRATGSFITDGFRVGSNVIVLNALDTSSANDGTYEILAVSATTLEVATGSWTTAGADTKALLTADDSKAVKLFLRIRNSDVQGKTFDSASLADIGADASGVDNKVFRFPLSNTGDLDIDVADAAIDNDGRDQVRVRYLGSPLTRNVDSDVSARNFGVVIDCASFTQVGAQTNGTSDVTWVSGDGSVALQGGEALTDYDGGTLTLHDATGADKGTFDIAPGPGSVSDTAGTLTITLDTATPGSETGLSFTMTQNSQIRTAKSVPSTGIPKVSIYERVHYYLRQESDVDFTGNVVNGSTADDLLQFIGPDLKAGTLSPVNPNDTDSNGVIIEGFYAESDKNNLFFVDNTGTERQFPFVSAGTINFNDNLVNDSDGFFWMFFTYTDRYTNAGFGLSSASGSTAQLDSATTDLTTINLADTDYLALSGFTNTDLNGIYVATSTPIAASVQVRRVDGTTLTNEAAGATVNLDMNPINSPQAILVDDNDGNPITGAITGASTPFTFDYNNNTQGDRQGETTANITLRAIGFDSAQFVETTGQITDSTTLSFTLVSGLERNYENPA